MAYTCPKDCEHGRVFASAGFCPVCNSKLYAVRNGKVEHSSHRPQHGGTFFMSRDGWHHLEGVRISATELRIYIYDNFTAPVAEDTRGSAEINGTSVKFSLAPDRTCLTATLPSNSTVSVAARIQFEHASSSELFNFTFSNPEHSPASERAPYPGPSKN